MSYHYVIPELLQGQTTCLREVTVCKAVNSLADDPALFQALSMGRRCVALYQSPSTEAPVLLFTWTTDDRPLGAEWKPFHVFRGDLTMPQNALLMKCALYVCPILLDGEYPRVDVIGAGANFTQMAKEHC